MSFVDMLSQKYDYTNKLIIMLWLPSWDAMIDYPNFGMNGHLSQISSALAARTLHMQVFISCIHPNSRETNGMQDNL